MAAPDDARRKADLDWLYGRDAAPTPEETRVIDEDRLQIYREQQAGQGAAHQATPNEPERPRTHEGRQSVTWSEADEPVRKPRTERPAERVRAERPRSERPRVEAAAARKPASQRPSREERRIVDAPRPGATRAPRRIGRTIKRIVLTILLAVLAYGIFLIATPLHAWSEAEVVDNTPAGARPANQPGTTFLLIGTDAREGLTDEEKERFGTGHVEGTRTDTMMMLHVPRKGRPVLVSLPRDSYVDIPGNGKNKLNASYAFGGAKLLTETVEQATGVRIDGYVEIGFAGFANVVDALGGIELCLDEPLVDHDSKLNLPAGCQTVNGTDALSYVRMRKADPRGDIGRIERQRSTITAIAKKAASVTSVTNPIKYWNLTHALTSEINRGPDTKVTTLIPAGLGVLKFATGDALSLTVPIADPNAITDAGSSVLWDEAQAAEMFGEIARGDTSNLDRFAK